MDEKRLANLCDITEIQMLKGRYCEASDSIVKDREAAGARFRELCTADVKGDYGLGELDGIDALCDFLVNAIGSSMQQLYHSIHTPMIEVKGDTATGRWSGMLRSKAKGADDVSPQYGYYYDEFRRTPSGWKVSAVRWVGEG